MAQQLTDAFIYQFSDANGLLVGGEVYFYEAGSTTTLADIWLDSGETTAASNPQTLGDLGELENVLYLNDDYNIVIFDRFGTQKFQRDNFSVTDTSSTVLSWMEDAQSAKAVIGRWTEVITQGITIAAGDIVFGDSAGSGLYELKSGGDYNVDPESDTYDPDSGIGVDWISISISSAEITESDITNLQDQIDAISASSDTSGYFIGLTLANGSDAAHDIDFAAGTAQDSTGAYRMTSASTFTKAIDAEWDSGTNQGGFPDNLSLAADTWYYAFIIGKQSDVNDVDFGFDTSATATNLLNGTNAGAEGFDIYRVVGRVRTYESSVNC